MNGFCHHRDMPRRPHHVVAFAMPSVVAFDLSTVAQVFGHVDEAAYTFEVAADRAGAVRTSTHFSLAGVSGLDALARADTIVIPGYTTHESPSSVVLDALQDAAARGCRMVSVCTGAFALAATGLLDGLRATTHWQDAALLQQRHPRVDVDAAVLYVDHGSVATSAGVAAGIDLCLHLVRRDLGHAEAARIARRMVVAPHRDGGQAQFIPPTVSETPRGFGDLTQWALRHLDEPLTAPQLAARAHMSKRHFARRFVHEFGVTPAAWVRHQRLLEARRLLETTDLPVDVIAQRVGLGSGVTLRRHLRDAVSLTPAAYRSMFSRQSSR